MEHERFEHDEKGQRYELYLGDELASLTAYRRDGDILVFNHTETVPRFQGRGLAAKVVRWALDDVGAHGLSVHPTCWFVADFIDAHPDYRTLLRDPRGRAAS